MNKRGLFVFLFLCISILVMGFFFTINSTYVFNNFNTDISGEKGEKIAYLTFDDGPTAITKDVLKVLKENQVTGTFFVIGQLLEENPDIAKSIVDEGHSICVHTYTHSENIYKSNISFMKDYSSCAELVKKITKNENLKFMRFPGGSSTIMAKKSTLKNIRSEIVDSGLYYVDWNVSIEDAVGRNRPVEVLLSNFNKEFKRSNEDERIIVLMHDSKYNKTTISALKNIISLLKSKGYTFKNFNDINDVEIKKLEEKRLINKFNKKEEPVSKE